MAELQKDFPGYKIHCFGRAYVYRFFYVQLLYDVLWSILATFIVWLFVLFHTKSIFISCSSMSMILFSFPITLVLYRDILGITNLSSLHLMVVFVVLGISADNIFVLWDAWRQSNTYPQLKGNLKKRMAYTFRRASKSLLATSSTTAFAFLSNGFSSLMPISAFGYFAFVVIPVNYVLIVLYYPAYLVFYDMYAAKWENKLKKFMFKCFSCFWCRDIDCKVLCLQMFLDRFDQE